MFLKIYSKYYIEHDFCCFVDFSMRRTLVTKECTFYIAIVWFSEPIKTCNVTVYFRTSTDEEFSFFQTMIRCESLQSNRVYSIILCPIFRPGSAKYTHLNILNKKKTFLKEIIKNILEWSNNNRKCTQYIFKYINILIF